MFHKFTKYILLLFLIILSFESPGKGLSFAQEDHTEDEMMDDADEAVIDEAGGTEVEKTGEGEEAEEEDDKRPQGSPDVDTLILFTEPSGNGEELPAGKLVEFLVGFTNNGDRDFILDSIDASFRYPMDFNFYIQNFTAIPYHRTVKPRHEATVMYSFYPADAFGGRPLGLNVNLAYHNVDGDEFVEAVFNQTVNIVEVDEGLDGETFFLYVFLLAFAVLLLLAGHHFLSSFGKKKGAPKAPVIETGTTSNGVDYDWIPKEVLNEIRKASPRQSPRSRKGARHS